MAWQREGVGRIQAPALLRAGGLVSTADPGGRLRRGGCFLPAVVRDPRRRPPRTLLDLGSGGGHNAAHLKASLACTLVDLAPAMLDLSRRLNPECEHVRATCARSGSTVSSTASWCTTR